MVDDKSIGANWTGIRRQHVMSVGYLKCVKVCKNAISVLHCC